MKKNAIYISLIFALCSLLGGFASAAQVSIYDAQVEQLASTLMTTLMNDVEPVLPATGEVEQVTGSLFMSLDGTFIKINDVVALSAQSLNQRWNGGVLLKDPQKAVTFLFDQKLTKYSTTGAFQTDSPLRRDEAAKFFTAFATNVIHKPTDSSVTGNCTFKDLAEGHTDLQQSVIDACKLNIFHGNNGMFNPTKSLTIGEALAVLIRITDGKMDETDTGHRAKLYRQKAQTYGLTQGTVMDSMSYLDTPISRGTIARLLEAASYLPSLREELGASVSYSLTSQGFVRTK